MHIIFLGSFYDLKFFFLTWLGGKMGMVIGSVGMVIGSEREKTEVQI